MCYFVETVEQSDAGVVYREAPGSRTSDEHEAIQRAMAKGAALAKGGQPYQVNVWREVGSGLILCWREDYRGEELERHGQACWLAELRLVAKYGPADLTADERAIVAALYREHGPMLVCELMAAADMGIRGVRRAIRRLVPMGLIEHPRGHMRYGWTLAPAGRGMAASLR